MEALQTSSPSWTKNGALRKLVLGNKAHNDRLDVKSRQAERTREVTSPSSRPSRRQYGPLRRLFNSRPIEGTPNDWYQSLVFMQAAGTREAASHSLCRCQYDPRIEGTPCDWFQSMVIMQ